MKLLALLVCLLLPMRTSALEIEAPAVPEAGASWMPEDTGSLWEGVGALLQKAFSSLRPDVVEASRVSLGILGAVLLISVLKSVPAHSGRPVELAGTVAVSALLLSNTGSMIHLASAAVREISAYGKLLLPVMTTALAAQGGVTTSAALYAGTALFVSVLQGAMSALLIPGIYLFLALSIGSAATGEEILKRMADLAKGFFSWCLKTMLILFTSYLSLSHVISGTTDAATLKAARVGVSTFVPVVGSILSDASETVLVGAGLMKNAAGIYGILAVLALCVHPFLKIGLHYLLLKLTGGICSLFGSGAVTGLLDRFTTAMGLLLAMTGAGCVMILVSTVCFMKGVG